MTTMTVEDAIARVPMWKNATDLKVSPLGGGLTNQNYRVDVGKKSYVLRISGDNTEMLGIDREYEYRTQMIAGELGIAPEAVAFLEPEGYIVTKFIEGRPIPPEELREPENLARVATLLNEIHSMPSIPGVFSPFMVVRNYARIAREHHVSFPEKFDWLISQMNDAEAAMMNTSRIQRPCHNDLLNGNFLLANKLYVLDWEYAGMGDVFFDLANFSNNHELSEHEDKFLLDCYFGNVTSQAIAHLNIMKIMSDFREAMWGLVQIRTSKLDFDFLGYANKHFRRLLQNALNPNWESWLREFR
ncbi:MAG TPA: choline/ethanolamine kinase family protein [Anaerolineales bacterium]|nr:choline/ethanolamine kinase family protein [Anaerolineales bacterium]